MSGHNGINKFLTTNRDGQAENFQLYGAQAQYDYANITGASITSANVITGQVVLGAGTTSPATFPSGLQFENEIQDTYPTTLGSTIDTLLINETNVAKVINLPGTIIEGNPPHTTTMRTCDGTNVITVPPCSALTAHIVNMGPENYEVFLEAGSGAGTTGITTINNLGTGAQLVATGTAPTATVRSIVGGDGITATQNANNVTIDFDGANLGAGEPIFVPGATANFKSLVAGAGTTLTAGANSVTIAADVTQQEAYNNSVVQGDFPIVGIFTTPFTMTSGNLRYDNGQRWAILETGDLSEHIGLTGAQFADAYQKRTGRVASAPFYNTETELPKNIRFFTDVSVIPSAERGIRSMQINNNLCKDVHGCYCNGLPMVTDVTPSVPLANCLILDGLSSAYTQNHPNDPNSGWGCQNWNYYYDHQADNTLAAVPTTANATVGTWTQFAVNQGLSLASISNTVYPVGSHLAPHSIKYCLGMFQLRNGPLNGNPNPATCQMDMSKNLKIGNFAPINTNEFSGGAYIFRVIALDTTDPANVATYFQTYHFINYQTTVAANRNITSISATQIPVSVVTHPPPTLTTPVDPRPGLRVTFTNGANGTAVNRNFVYQVWVERYDVCVFL